MLLAAGVYPRFIGAIGELTTLKFRRPSLVVLGSVMAAAVAAVFLLGGPVVYLVVHHRWMMYSLFIGLTLGGVPVVWRLVRASVDGAATTQAGTVPHATPGHRLRGRGLGPVWIGAVVGFVGMAALAVYQSSGASGDAHRQGVLFMLLAGVAGASAMILPGVSGAYLLLVLGVYVPILVGVDQFKEGVLDLDLSVVTGVGLSVVLPVGVGVIVGVVGVSNLLRWLLQRYERATLGVLLGLLLGAVVGLWPFEETVNPEVGSLIKNQRVILGQVGDPAEALTTGYIFEHSGEPVPAEDLPTRRFTPSTGQIMGAIGLIVLGFGVTLGVDRLGREK